MTRKRKLDGSYISFDFICIAKCDGTQKPDCAKFPANKSMKSKKLIFEYITQYRIFICWRKSPVLKE